MPEADAGDFPPEVDDVDVHVRPRAQRAPPVTHGPAYELEHRPRLEGARSMHNWYLASCGGLWAAALLAWLLT